MSTVETRKNIAALKKRANLQTRDEFGDTPLHLAVEHGDMDTAKLLLLVGASLETRNAAGQTPMSNAIEAGCLSMIRLLMDAGSNLEERDGLGRTPLYCALESGNEEALRMLLEAGADVGARDSVGNTPLHWVIGRSTVEAAKLLIDNGADLAAQNSDGMTPLHVAALLGEWDLVALFVSAGASLEARDTSGKTPLHRATQTGRAKAAKVLVDAGADVEAVDKDGITPSQLAEDKGFTAVMKLLAAKVEKKIAIDRPMEHSDLLQKKEEEHAPLKPESLKQATPAPQLSSQMTTTASDLSERPQNGKSSKQSLQSVVSAQEAPRPSHHLPVQESGDASYPSPFPSSSSSQESKSSDSTADCAHMQAVRNLVKGDVFAGDYKIESKIFIGKPLVRSATGITSGERIILKFYIDCDLFRKSVAFYELVNQSTYICKPIQRVLAHEEFPDCLVFQMGAYTFDDWMRIPDITPGSRREALQLVAAALEDLHAYDVVHCDIKPANLAFFPLEFKWKMLDLDSALKVNEPSTVMTTIPYAAPEILLAVEKGQERIALETSADMWSYGIIAYEVFTERRFYDEDPTVESVLAFLRSDGIKRRSMSVQDNKQRHFIKKFLKWDPNERKSATAASSSSIFGVASITTSKTLTLNR